MADNQQEKIGASGCGNNLDTPNHVGTGDPNDMAPAKRTTAPAFQFYAKDFLSSSKVQRMTLTEVGVYIILLAHNWLSGGIPTDPAEIGKIVKLPAVRFRKMWAGPLSECFVKRGAHLTNPRIEQERQKQIAFRERQSVNGKKGGRVSQALEVGKATDKGLVSPCVMESADSSALSGSLEKGDVAFAAFRDAYPGARRKGGALVEGWFLSAATQAGGVAALMAALENHKASEQWSNPRMIPGMDVWLAEERWRQELPPAGAVTASANNPKTAGNHAVLQRFIDRGRTA